MMRTRPLIVSSLFGVLLAAGACKSDTPPDRVRASGHIEATDVQVGPEVGGRVIEVAVDEGRRVNAGDTIARLDTADTELAIRRAEAERDQALAQARLLRAGSRSEDIRQAQAQVEAADAEGGAAREELRSAESDLERFEALLRSNAGSRKQRDDAATRRDIAREKVRGAEQRSRGAREALARLRAGARPEEIAAADARVAGVEAQIATLRKALGDAVLKSPVAGIVTEKLVDSGEIIPPRAPIVVITDLDHAWAEVFVDEPLVPRLKLGQDATLFTDAGGEGVAGTVSYISPKAEFTPRNVQTADERAKLVYRVKVSVDNRSGTFKPGMPVEADLQLQPRP
jgi:membrane fusion protein YbhG